MSFIHMQVNVRGGEQTHKAHDFRIDFEPTTHQLAGVYEHKLHDLLSKRESSNYTYARTLASFKV